MIVGVDIGTSVTKACLVHHDGTVGPPASRPSKLSRFDGGLVEQDLDQVIGSVAEVIREVLEGRPETPEAIAITGQGDGLWLRDAHGRAVRPPISWSDARASSIVDDWSQGGRDSVVSKVYALTGSGIFPGSQASLLAWMAIHEPENLQRAAVAGYCVDAVIESLTGVVTVDASDASLPFLDVTTRTYVDAALELCGLSEWKHLLASPAASGTALELSGQGAQLLGLPAGLPIVAAPYDLQSCGFGAGTTRVGEGTLVVGTTLSCQVLTDDASIDPHDEPAGMWLCTPEGNTYLRVMPSMVGTAGIDWILEMFGLAPAQLDELLASTRPTGTTVRALSFLSSAGERAPFVDPSARGQFTGLSLQTTRADMVRALCESLAFAARHCFEAMGLKGELAATGGGMRSGQLAQTFCDVIGRSLFLPNDPEVGARGAALVAWSVLGDPVDEDLWRSQRTRIDPDPARAAGYNHGYELYRADLAEARARWDQLQ